MMPIATQSTSPQSKRAKGVLSSLVSIPIRLGLTAILAGVIWILGLFTYRITHSEPELLGFNQQWNPEFKMPLTIHGLFTKVDHDSQMLCEKIKHTLNPFQNAFFKKNKKLQCVIQKISQTQIFYTTKIIVYLATAIMLSRMQYVFAWLPFLGLALSLGLIDGFGQRRIRQYCAARESSFWFHSLGRLLGSYGMYLPILAYFLYPLPIDSGLFFVPMAMILGMLAQSTVKHFKKYV